MGDRRQRAPGGPGNVPPDACARTTNYSGLSAGSHVNEARERLNWDGSEPFDTLLALWARTTRDRDFVPAKGDSSRQAGARLRAFLAHLPGGPGPVAMVTHGGITPDLLRTVLGDDALPPHVLGAGIRPCAVTAVDDLGVVMIASTSHLL
jgi:broad specificity phosphatase PhoE